MLHKCFELRFRMQVFPDWFHKNTQQWWTEALRNWSAAGIEFSGIWLDMNEASSFCDGSWLVLPISLNKPSTNIFMDWANSQRNRSQHLQYQYSVPPSGWPGQSHSRYVLGNLRQYIRDHQTLCRLSRMVSSILFTKITAYWETKLRFDIVWPQWQYYGQWIIVMRLRNLEGSRFHDQWTWMAGRGSRS